MGRRFDRKGKNKKKASREQEASRRVTYLWGAAHLLAASSPRLSSFYVRCIKQVGRRVTLGLDAVSVKRWTCKRCHALLAPGVGPGGGARVRTSARRETHVVVACGACGAVRRYLARPPPVDAVDAADGHAAEGGGAAAACASGAAGASDSGAVGDSASGAVLT